MNRSICISRATQDEAERLQNLDESTMDAIAYSEAYQDDEARQWITRPVDAFTMKKAGFIVTARLAASWRLDIDEKLRTRANTCI